MGVSQNRAVNFIEKGLMGIEIDSVLHFITDDTGIRVALGNGRWVCIYVWKRRVKSGRALAYSLNSIRVSHETTETSPQHNPTLHERN